MSFFDRLMRLFGFKDSKQKDFNQSVPKDDYDYNEIESQKRKEVDRILDKISKKGISSISKKEKLFLDKESKK